MRPDGSDMDHAEWLNGPEEPPMCAHGIAWGESCPACGVAIAAESADALKRALARIARQEQDAAGLAERRWTQR